LPIAPEDKRVGSSKVVMGGGMLKDKKLLKELGYRVPDLERAL